MKFSVVTFNLRTEAIVDGPNYFFNRAPYIITKVRKEMPDIICFQECTPRMLEWLRCSLHEYEVVGLGRNAALDGESNPVAYRKDKFDLFGLDQFWLSPTPFVPGTRYEHQSRCPRICMTVCLSPKNTGKLFRVYNTHLDHVDEQARELGMNQVINKIAEDNRKMRLPLVVTGDMNALPEEISIQNILNFEEIPMQEVTASVPLTFHGYNPGRRSEYRIDYIITDKGLEFSEPVIWDDEYEVGGNKIYLSDHYPIVSEIEFFKD